MEAWIRYFEEMNNVVKKIMDTQGENIMKAANVLADVTENDGIIYGFGTGHSHLIPEESFRRAATPANFACLFEPSASGSFEISRSYVIENTYGIGKSVIDYHRITPKDVIIAVSNSGNNIAAVEAAMTAKEKGIPVIAITNVEYGNFLKTKHKDGKKLKDVADIVIDNCSPIGDAAIDVEGFPMKVGSTSTIPAVYIQTALLSQMVEILVKRGFMPDVYYNDHLAFMDESLKGHNEKIGDKYFYRIRNL